MNTAPFDLKKALAGHPLVTVDGLPVTGFRKRDPDIHYASTFPFVASLSGREELFTRKGRFKDYAPDHRDLCLLLEPKPPVSIGETGETGGFVHQSPSVPDFFHSSPTVLDDPFGEFVEPPANLLHLEGVVLEHLVRLTSTGLYGNTPAETALLLVKQVLRELKTTELA